MEQIIFDCLTANYGLVFIFGIGFSVDTDFFNLEFNYDISKIKSQLILHDA